MPADLDTATRLRAQSETDSDLVAALAERGIGYVTSHRPLKLSRRLVIETRVYVWDEATGKLVGLDPYVG